jgi:deoxyribonuclease-4
MASKATTKKESPDTQPVHRFGAHLSVAGGMVNALHAARDTGCDALQVFVKNQRQWQAKPFESVEISAWLNELERSALQPVVAHASYLINLASDDAALAKKSQQALVDEMQRCDQLSIPYLVLHPGAAMKQTTEAALERVAKALNRIHRSEPELRCQVLLETTAGQGTTLGRTFAELGTILDQLEQPQRIAVCVDTCHVFAAGYDIRSESGYAAMMREAGESVGLDRIRCWHLNDSVGELGSHKDRHAHVGHGELGKAGFRQLLADQRMMGLPMILETPKGTDQAGRDWDRKNLRRLRQMAAANRKRRKNE